MLFIPITIAAAALQVGRNAAQRGLVGSAGPWGATLVRFLFGLPFSLAIAATVMALHPSVRLEFSSLFLINAAIGAAAQLLATTALLAAMRMSGFAVATAFQQSSLLMAAGIGWIIYGDALSAGQWLGAAIATAGLIALSWPRRAGASISFAGAGFGLLSGFLFGLALNNYRFAALSLGTDQTLVASSLTVAFTQGLQSASLAGALAIWSRPSLVAVVRGWRGSLTAGLCGALASVGWLFALTLAPAAQVRAVGVVEMPIAALVGRRLFKERVSLWQWLAGAATAAGVALTALG